MKDDCREVLASVEAHLSLLLEEVRVVLAEAPAKKKKAKKKVDNFSEDKEGFIAP